MSNGTPEQDELNYNAPPSDQQEAENNLELRIAENMARGICNVIESIKTNTIDTETEVELNNIDCELKITITLWETEIEVLQKYLTNYASKYVVKKVRQVL